MDRDFLIDLFADFGPVTIRRMFSGFGISADGTNFALALRAGLYFRADDQTIPQFEAEGSRPFQYQTRAKTVTVNSYWQLPARLFEDPEELTGWAKAALAAAQRAALRKRPKAKKATAQKKPAAKMKKAANKKKKSTGEILGRVTISVGVSMLKPGDDTDSLIERADACLYAAKRNGRNRVICEVDPEYAAETHDGSPDVPQTVILQTVIPA